MTFQTSPRVNVRAAFKAVLEAANLDGVTIHERLPYPGADPRSVVLTIVSGTSRSPGIGLRKDATIRSFELPYRLQVDCYDDLSGVDALADKVEQALVDAIDTLESGYDIHSLRKAADVDRPAAQMPSTEGRVMFEFTFYTHRELTA
jgi:hypothetical protein